MCPLTTVSQALGMPAAEEEEEAKKATLLKRMASGIKDASTRGGTRDRANFGSWFAPHEGSYRDAEGSVARGFLSRKHRVANAADEDGGGNAEGDKEGSRRPGLLSRMISVKHRGPRPPADEMDNVADILRDFEQGGEGAAAAANGDSSTGKRRSGRRPAAPSAGKSFLAGIKSRMSAKRFIPRVSSGGDGGSDAGAPRAGKPAEHAD